ncbi:MAG: replication initiation protein [Gammaproteobacteria bacterium]
MIKSTQSKQGQIARKNGELKKHTAAIHSSGMLTLLQRKINNALLFHAYPELKNVEEHQITIRELCQIIGYRGNNHGVIKDALRGLVSTIVEWNVVNDNCSEEDWTASTIIASVSIKGPNCYYAYSPRMKELLYSPSVYGKINLIIQSKFKSSYGLALYENCVRYKGLSSTKWFELDVFRKLMGVPSGKYDIFRDFKRRVLDKSIEEVNAFSDLIVEPEIKKERRQVKQIRFKLSAREKRNRIGQTELESYALTEDQIAYIAKLKTFGFTKTQAADLLNDFGEERIAEKISFVEQSSSFKKGEINNLAAYFLSALRGDYQAKSSRQHLESQYLEKEKEMLKLQQKRKHDEALKNRYQHYVVDFIEKAYRLLPDTEKRVMERSFISSLEEKNNQMMLNLYHRNGLEHSIVRSVFRGYIREHYPVLVNGLLSKEQFESL